MTATDDHADGQEEQRFREISQERGKRLKYDECVEQARLRRRDSVSADDEVENRKYQSNTSERYGKKKDKVFRMLQACSQRNRRTKRGKDNI